MRVMLVDDNKHALCNLKKILNDLKINVVAETTKVENIEELLLENNPDVIFLDIDLNHEIENGITIANRLAKIKPDIIIIYATAHSEYALETYNADIPAVDYILKPFNQIKVSKALQKAKKILGKKNSEYVKIKDKEDNILMLEINNIIFIEKENNSRSSTIYYGEDRIITTESLQLLEEKLTPFNHFLRSHKSYIINKNKIKLIEYDSKTSDKVYFWGCNSTALIIKSKKKLI